MVIAKEDEVIITFQHAGLKKAYKRNQYSKVPSDQVKRIRVALSDLDSARRITDMDLPKYRLHSLRGEMEGYWSIKISANWRMVFRFEGGDAYEVDLIDYH